MENKFFNYYLAHQNELVEKYNGLFVVINKNGFAGAYKEESDAYHDAEKKFGPGNFGFWKCSPGDADYTARIYSPSVKF